MLTDLPLRGPSSVTWKGPDAWYTWGPPYLWGGEGAALRPWRGGWHAPFETPKLWHPKGWEHHPFLAKGLKCTPPWRTLAPLDSSRLSTEGALLSLAFLGCFAPFGGITSPFSTSCTFLFLFKSRLGSSPTAVIGRGGGGRLRGTWVLGTFLEADPLFLLASRPFKLVLYFKSMPPSSSFELASTRATINLGEWAAENLSKSASESESSTGLSGTSPSSSRWNWSILTLRDKGVEVISSLGVATSWGTR